MTTERTSAPHQIVEAVRLFFRDHEVASLRLPSGWFGRPYDNWHQLTDVSSDGELILIRLDERQLLKREAADLALDGRVLRVVISAGEWEWTDYGGTDRHHEELSRGSVEFHAPFHRP